MSAHLYCCPLCSVAEPPGTVLSAEMRRGFYRGPQMWQGRRSGKFWIVRNLSCHHGPNPDHAAGSDSSYALAGEWNTWAKSEAEAKADRLKFDAERRAQWLYGLGMAPLAEVLGVGSGS